MRHWITAVLSKLVRRTAGFTPSYRPILERLEDRCLPSTGMMMMGMPMSPMNNPPMGMPAMTMPSTNMQSMGMPAMTMPSTNMQPMGMNTMSNGMNPNSLAAIDQLFTDFDQTLQQMLASKTVQQFITNEVHMIQVLATDLAQIRMSVGQMV